MPRDRQPHVRYPDLYTWLVFVSALDLMLTYLILYIGGYEANAVASAVLHAFGFNGMIIFKFAIVLLVVVLCEIIGHRDAVWGRRLGMIGVAVTCVPVLLALLLLTGRVNHFI